MIPAREGGDTMRESNTSKFCLVKTTPIVSRNYLFCYYYSTLFDFVN